LFMNYAIINAKKKGGWSSVAADFWFSKMSLHLDVTTICATSNSCHLYINLERCHILFLEFLFI
jgi:hypothetical protein